MILGTDAVARAPHPFVVVSFERKSACRRRLIRMAVASEATELPWIYSLAE